MKAMSLSKSSVPLNSATRFRDCDVKASNIFSSCAKTEAFPGHGQAKQDLAATRRHVVTQGQGSPCLGENGLATPMGLSLISQFTQPLSGAWLALSPAAQFIRNRLWTASRVALGRKVSNTEVCLQGGQRRESTSWG